MTAANSNEPCPVPKQDELKAASAGWAVINLRWINAQEYGGQLEDHAIAAGYLAGVRLLEICQQTRKCG